MLRASVEATDASLDPRGITDAEVDSLIPGGEQLVALVDAVIGDEGDIAKARDEVLAELGPNGLVDAGGVLGNFEMMNRIADATGTPVGKGTLRRTEDWRRASGIDLLFPDHA